TCGQYLAASYGCSKPAASATGDRYVCDYFHSAPGDWCANDRDGTSSSCELYGVHRWLNQKPCFDAPGTPRCPGLGVGLDWTGTAAAKYGTCNDGTTVAIIPSLVTRTWGQLNAAEQSQVKTLMNNAALAGGCNDNVDFWGIYDAGPTGFYKWYPSS